MTDKVRQALRAIIDTLDAEEMGEGPPASEHVAHWQKLHDDGTAALAALDAPAEGEASAPPAPDGLEPAAWGTRGMNVLSRWMPWVMIDKVRAERWREDPSYKNGRREVEPLYSAATLSAQEAEIERLRKQIADMETSYDNSIQEMSERFRAVNIAKAIEQSGVNFISLAARAESAEAEVARLRKVVERAREVIAPPASLPRR